MSISESFKHSKYEMTLDTAVQQAEISHAHRFPLEEKRFARETKRREVLKSGCIIRWLAGIFFFASIATSLL